MTPKMIEVDKKLTAISLYYRNLASRFISEPMTDDTLGRIPCVWCDLGWEQCPCYDEEGSDGIK